MKRVVLSKAADADLEAVFDYTLEAFGIDQAISYVSSFDDVFLTLAGNPEIGRERGEIRKELRSLTKGSHVIFYRMMKDHVRIVRILHGSCDLPKFLE